MKPGAYFRLLDSDGQLIQGQSVRFGDALKGAKFADSAYLSLFCRMFSEGKMAELV